MERSSFEIFKSNICHLVKDKGELSFIRDMLCSDEVSKLYERKWYAECLYLLAMIDYLSRKNDIPLYNGYDKLRTGKLDKVFHTKIGVKLCSMAGGGVSRNLWNFFRTAPAGTGQAVTCSTSGMGLRLK